MVLFPRSEPAAVCGVGRQDALGRAKVAEEELAEKEKDLDKERKRRDRGDNHQASISDDLKEMKRLNDRFLKENKILERRKMEIEVTPHPDRERGRWLYANKDCSSRELIFVHLYTNTMECRGWDK